MCLEFELKDVGETEQTPHHLSVLERRCDIDEGGQFVEEDSSDDVIDEGELVKCGDDETGSSCGLRPLQELNHNIPEKPIVGVTGQKCKFFDVILLVVLNYDTDELVDALTRLHDLDIDRSQQSIDTVLSLVAETDLCWFVEHWGHCQIALVVGLVGAVK